METIDKLLVSLDPQCGEDILLKSVHGSYMNKAVKSLLDYMLDPCSDGLNPGYNEGEKRVAEIIRTWREKARLNPRDEFVISAKPADGSNLFGLDLETTLNTYQNRILQSRPVPGGDPSVILPYIELFASYREGGRTLNLHIQFG